MVVGFITGLKIYHICPIRIEIIYGRGKFVGDFNMGTLLRNMD
jgi:hypothetical protein